MAPFGRKTPPPYRSKVKNSYSWMQKSKIVFNYFIIIEHWRNHWHIFTFRSLFSDMITRGYCGSIWLVQWMFYNIKYFLESSPVMLKSCKLQIRINQAWNEENEVVMAKYNDHFEYDCFQDDHYQLLLAWGSL